MALQEPGLGIEDRNESQIRTKNYFPQLPSAFSLLVRFALVAQEV
jgi:hypothetical protein